MAGAYECWAWVTLEPSGRECMVGALVGDFHTPLLHRDRAVVMGPMGELALSHHRTTDQPVRMVHLVEVSE